MQGNVLTGIASTGILYHNYSLNASLTNSCRNPVAAVAEAYKYTLKPGMLPNLSDADLSEYIDAVRGVH